MYSNTTCSAVLELLLCGRSWPVSSVIFGRGGRDHEASGLSPWSGERTSIASGRTGAGHGQRTWRLQQQKRPWQPCAATEAAFFCLKLRVFTGGGRVLRPRPRLPIPRGEGGKKTSPAPALACSFAARARSRAPSPGLSRRWRAGSDERFPSRPQPRNVVVRRAMAEGRRERGQPQFDAGVALPLPGRRGSRPAAAAATAHSPRVGTAMRVAKARAAMARVAGAAALTVAKATVASARGRLLPPVCHAGHGFGTLLDPVYLTEELCPRCKTSLGFLFFQRHAKALGWRRLKRTGRIARKVPKLSFAKASSLYFAGPPVRGTAMGEALRARPSQAGRYQCRGRRQKRLPRVGGRRAGSDKAKALVAGRARSGLKRPFSRMDPSE